MSSSPVPHTTAPTEHTTLDSLVADVCCQIVEYLGFSKDASALAATSSTWLEYVRFSPAYYERLRSKYPFRFRMASQKHDGVDPRDVDWRQHLIEAGRSSRGQIKSTDVMSVATATADTKQTKQAKSGMGAFFSSIFGSRLSGLFGGGKSRILVVGLDAAGKTSVLFRMRLGEITTVVPVIGLNVETVQYKNIVFTSWDLGGGDKIRTYWRQYYKNTDAVIFVVDSNDRDRISEEMGNCDNGAADEFNRLVRDLEADSENGISYLILANKQDLPNAMSPEEIAVAFHMEQHTTQQWCVQGCSAGKGDGLYEGLDWLSNVLKSK